jgi:hypothetical protein
VLNANGSVSSETAWSGDGSSGGSGGGLSKDFSTPSYQSSLELPSRGVPDVAADANPAIGITIVLNGTVTVVGEPRRRLRFGPVLWDWSIKCTPHDYETSDPLKPNWYEPQAWFAMSKQTHASRLPKIIPHPVSDLLKPGMPAKRELSMRQLRHLLRLHDDGVSAREIGRLLRSGDQPDLRGHGGALLGWHPAGAAGKAAGQGKGRGRGQMRRTWTRPWPGAPAMTSTRARRSSTMPSRAAAS